MIHQQLLKRLVIGAIILLAGNIVITMMLNPAVTSAQVSPHQKTMYKVAHARNNEQEIQTIVDIFSRDGWELVTYNNEILIFKKQ